MNSKAIFFITEQAKAFVAEVEKVLQEPFGDRDQNL